MTYKITVIFFPDPEFWEKDEEHPDEEPYSWNEQKDFESLAEADAWVTSHYVIEDVVEHFANQGLHLLIASDLERNGIALEVLTKDEELAAELFYSDVDGSLTVTQVNQPISTEDLQLLMKTAKRRLTPTNTEQVGGGKRE